MSICTRIKKKKNTTYDFAADVTLNNCFIFVQETVQVFKWQVGVLTAKKKEKTQFSLALNLI